MSEHITDVVLNETDRDLMQLAARIVTALDSGNTRIGALETIIQATGTTLEKRIRAPSPRCWMAWLRALAARFCSRWSA
jgi:hypothetical protein